ncbi:hypothetical protein K458DRAFT_412069 [Lentithecium fluviatile CBS 122367]|uniref:Essential protein Yae1 N-terminal domain-containing protein n=1 Tax=Lentithecium fluviatile CBS 122367 TaxID=1168545 RepID=A0A6G1JJH7_9PLEO|nr:hypothetical protein K458DRAFT_412069 [Lentithecium fluviatile CBS 122367]
MAGTPHEDPFDTLLTLEDTLYTTAYTQGTTDGAHAGRIEGRIFGLEKGFDKFAALGTLHGRALVWAGQLPQLPSPQRKRAVEKDGGGVGVEGGRQDVATDADAETEGSKEVDADVEIGVEGGGGFVLPKLKESTRLRAHITTLHALTHPPTFSTLNTEDAVADFEDRVKRAGAKAKIIERIASPRTSSTTADTAPMPGSLDGIAAAPKKGSTNVRMKVNSGAEARTGGKGDDSMEDFTGSRFLR